MSTAETINPLDALAAQAGALDTAGAVPGATGGPGAAEADADAEQSLAALEAGAVKVVLMLLKVGRALIAKRLPEIVDEWPDDVLKPPAEAAVPLLKKHMEGLMKMAASSPETAALVVSCIPLLMGLLAAVDKAGTKEKTKAKAHGLELVKNAGT